ncbi:helix-turn-helix domain-containing protein [Arsenophonus sp.]|uniref:helix-turn-helix domain-containing protein n=1 Tax=Arsenophonus sp. TaxID=1872640 RepID=UPI0038791468
MEDIFLTVKETSKILKVSEKTIRDKAVNGKIPAYKIFGEWRFSRNEIDTFILNQKNTSCKTEQYIGDHILD